MEIMAVSAADADTRRIIRARKRLQEAITQIERMEQRTATEGFLLMDMRRADKGFKKSVQERSGDGLAAN